MNNQKFVWTTVRPLQVLSTIIPLILSEYLCKSEKKKSAFLLSVFSHLFFKVSEQKVSDRYQKSNEKKAKWGMGRSRKRKRS